MENLSLDNLRTEISKCRRSASGHRLFPKALRHRLTLYALAQESSGTAICRTAKSLGVRDSLVYRWVRKDRRIPHKAPPQLVPVTVSAQPSPALTIYGPHGLRIENIDTDTLAKLWRILAH